MKEILYLEDVCIDFGSAFSLNKLSFQVMQGEIYGFLGPSGAGKTTTIKLLTGQLKKKSGIIRIFGKDISQFGREDYEHIGILSDTSGLYERMSIEENLRFFASLRGVKDPGGKTADVLKRVHLYDQRKTQIKKASKGMKQRTLLAAAVLHGPQLLFLDEPTVGLDPATIQEVHRMLLQLNRDDATIFLTTHNMEEADRLCGRIGILNQGELAAAGAPMDLKLKFARNEIEVLTSTGLRTVSKDMAGAERILEWMRDGELLTVHSKEPDLAEIFIELTGRELV